MGLLAADDVAAGGVSFSPRRHAFREGRALPIVRPKGPIDSDVVDRASYFVTLHLARINWTIVADRVRPTASAWVEMNALASPLLDRLDGRSQNLLFRGKRPRVKRPRSEAWPEGESLKERKRPLERGLVTRRVLRPKTR